MDEALKSLIGQGLLGALLIIAGGVIAFLYNQNSKLQAKLIELQRESQEDANDLHQKRLDEALRILTVLQQGNLVTDRLTLSVESRTEALNELIKGFAALVSTTEQHRERFREQAGRIEETLKAIHNATGLVHTAIGELKSLIRQDEPRRRNS